MARKTKSFKIEGYDKQFKVKELTVREIISLIQDEALDGELSLDDFKEYFSEQLPKFSNIESLESLMDMAPSEIKQIWDKFSEVNAVFFDVARKAGLDNMLGKLRQAILADFLNWLAPSSKPDTKSA
jgi:hypothetical protein